jgi:hypothetical protein
MRRWIGFGLCLAPWLLAESNSSKNIITYENSAARVLYLEGSALMRGSLDHYETLKVGQWLESGSIIKTESKSTVLLEFPNKSLTKVNPSSRVTLTLVTASGSNSQVELQLEAGSISNRVNSVKKNSRFLVRTRNNVMGVRGTEFYVSLQGNPKASLQDRDLWLCVREGKVQIEPVEEGTYEPLSVPAGLGVLAKRDLTPSAPQKYDWTDDLNWNFDPAKGAILETYRTDHLYFDLLDQDYD